MRYQVKRWIAPPVFEGDEEKTRVAALTHTLLLAALLSEVLLIGSRFALRAPITNTTGSLILVMTLATLGLFALLHYGYVRATGLAFSITLWVILTCATLSDGGIHDAALTGYFVIIMLAGALLGGRALIFFTTLCVLTLVATFYAEHAYLIRPHIDVPSAPIDLMFPVVMISVSGILLNYALRQVATAYTLARKDAEALSESNQELQSSRQALENQTRNMERQARYLEATARVARDAATILDTRELLSRLVNLISEQLGFYHTGIFLLDSNHEAAELRAASSPEGQRLLARGYRVAMDGKHIISRVAMQGRHQAAIGTKPDSVRFESSELPETRAELALPLQTRGEIMGVLDVHARESRSFTDQDITALQSLADQLAVTISNATLFERLEESLAAERRAYGELVAGGWQQLFRSEPVLSVVSREQGVSPASERLRPEMKEALQRGEVVLNGADQTALAIPIKVRNRVIGVLDGRKPESAAQWSKEEIETLQTLTEQIGLALESARLYKDTQRTLAETRALYETSREVTSAAGMSEVLSAVLDNLAHSGVHTAAIALFDAPTREEAKYIELAGVWDYAETPRMAPGVRFALSDFPLFDRITRERALVSRDLLADPEFDAMAKSVLGGLGLRAVAITPLLARGQWMGVLFALMEEPHTFTAAELNFQRALADQAAVAIDNRRLLAETERRAAREHLIGSVTARMRESLDLETVLKTAAAEMRQALGLEEFVVTLAMDEAENGEATI
jgi:GAF domain-containing protein